MTEGSQIFNVSATFLLCSPDQLKNMFILLFVQFVANGLQLPEGGDLEALHCQPSTNFDRITKLDLTTDPPLLGRCC